MIRVKLSCDFAHPDWIYLIDDINLLTDKMERCPICGELAVSKMVLPVADKACIRIENGLFYNQRVKKNCGERTYSIIIEDWDKNERYRSPYFYNWGKISESLERLREMSLQQSIDFMKKVDGMPPEEETRKSYLKLVKERVSAKGEPLGADGTPDASP